MASKIQTKDAYPTRYELAFEPNLKKSTFSGKEKISAVLRKPTKELSLDAAELKIKKCHLVSGKRDLKVKWSLDRKNEKLKLTFPERVSGTVELSIDFEGTLNDKLVGFYRSDYTDKGKKKFLATTQFEATDARRAFPCWDRPDFKATFDLSILVDKNLVAISNMPAVSKKRIGKKVLYKFSRTPVMSTYLLYLGVGEFEFLTGRLGKTLIRIVTTRGKKAHARLALELTKRFLDWYQRYFGIAYPLPKLDMIAIPDFAAGAMENWGAITFRENYLLFDEKASSTETKQAIADIISHELAHQWFGNLVTMMWWNDLWLNESFATFIGNKAVDSLFPQWELWKHFLKDDFAGALALDALRSSHPIDVKVEDPAHIRQIFDDISYKKGGSLLRMLESYLDEARFRAGLKRYLTEHKYGNATTADLWTALENATRKPVRRMMDGWVKQTGFPIVKPEIRDSKVLLNQERYFALGGQRSKESWLIPLSIKTDKGTLDKLMTARSDSIDLGGAAWFKVNHGQTGFYRVFYQGGELDRLKILVRDKTLPPEDRWGILNDAFALCISRRLPVKDFLDLVSWYFEEDDYLVATEVARDLDFLYVLTFNGPLAKDVRELALEFFGKQLSRLGWEKRPGEPENIALLRSSVIGSLGLLGDADVGAEAARRFEDYKKDPASLDPDLRAVVYSLAALNGDKKTFDFLVGLYKKAALQEEKAMFLRALPNFKGRSLVTWALDFALSKEVRPHNFPLVFIKAAHNPYGRSLVWPWLKRNWKAVVKKLGGGGPLLGKIVESLALAAGTGIEKDIRGFFKSNPLPGIDMKLAHALERSRIYSLFVDSLRRAEIK